MNIPATLTNPQPKRDIRVFQVEMPDGNLYEVAATLTYREDRLVGVRLRAEHADDSASKMLNLFAATTSQALSSGFSVDDIERWLVTAGLERFAKPLIAALREPPG